MLERILQDIGLAGGIPYYVGGYVRDQKLGIPCKDIDIETHGLSAAEFLHVLKKHGEVTLAGESFGVWRLKGLDVDFSLPRRERSFGPGHTEFEVSIDGRMSIEEAFRRRDFTINAMGINALTGEMVDPFNGKQDLEDRILQVVDPKTFVEDPLRVLRGAQFCARMGLTAEKETTRLCKRLAPEYGTLASERVFEELKKLLLKGEMPSLGIQFLQDTTWLWEWPELSLLDRVPQDPKHHPEGDALVHTKEVVDRAAWIRPQIPEEDRLTYMLSALLHDVGKYTHTFYRTEPKRLTHWQKDRPKNSRIVSYGHDQHGEKPAYEFLKRLTNQADILHRVPRLVFWHMKPLLCKESGDKAFRRMSKQGCEMWLVGMLSWADKGERPTYWFNTIDRLKLNGPRETIVKGRHLIERGLEPGPRFSQIIQRCEEVYISKGITDPELLLNQVIGRRK